MKLKSDPKTGLFSYIVAFGFLLFIAVDIAKSLNETSQPVQQAVPVVAPIVPKYTKIPIPVSQREGTKNYHLMELRKEASVTYFLYSVTYSDLVHDPVNNPIPQMHTYFVRAETMCQLNTFRHKGQGDSVDAITEVEGTWYEPKQGDNVFDIVAFVCGIK
jgi:hypothetical protein